MYSNSKFPITITKSHIFHLDPVLLDSTLNSTQPCIIVARHKIHRKIIPGQITYQTKYYSDKRLQRTILV